MTTKILILKSMRKGISNSNKKMKSEDLNHHHSMDQFGYRNSVTLYPLGHLAHEW